LELLVGKVILFYKYIFIKYPKQIQKWQQKICSQLGLTGRILIAHEGINATLGGTFENIDRYIALMRSHQLFSDIDFKESNGGADCFPRLQIKVKDEIVRLSLDTEKLKASDGGLHLTPEQTHALLSNKPDDLVILDARNNYESQIGRFEDAIIPDIAYFRQFPEFIDQNKEQFRDKTVLMYCTGGIRCERASAYLKLKQVARQVYQVSGGICKYVEKYPNGFFKGKNYVFDGRLSMQVNEEILSQCFLCEKSFDRYTNCLNAACNKHFICCQSCKISCENFCSSPCKDAVLNCPTSKRPPLHVVKYE